MRRLSGLMRVPALILVALAAAACAVPARADHVDLSEFLPITAEEGAEIRHIAGGVLGRLGLDSRECEAPARTIRLCARPGAGVAAPLTGRWDRAFELLAAGWSGAALPWRQIAGETGILGYRKSFATDRGETVLLLRVFVPAGYGAALEVQASKHPWQ